MSKLCILAVLLYNIAISVAFSSEKKADSYNDLVDNTRFSLLDPLKGFETKDKEIYRSTTESWYLEHWTGRWMPDRPGNPTPPPKILSSVTQGPTHRLPMGKIEDCDDGKTNLEVDWDKSDVNYTCFGRLITPELSIRPLLYSQIVPYSYSAMHKCMNETIEYDDDIPLYGTHRPVYPVYGEYKFLPKQRWLHSLEHGAVVMLYHPCANPLEVKYLKNLVKKCLRRHIISPYSLLDEERPLALLTWGSRLTMSYVNPEIIKDFIQDKGLRGPENIPVDGDFEEGLVSQSQIVTDFFDSSVCPHM